MTHTRRWVLPSALLLASLWVGVARADDFDSLPLPPDEAPPAAPAEAAPAAAVPASAAAAPAPAAAAPAPAADPALVQPATAQATGMAEPAATASAEGAPTEAGTADEAFDLKTKALEEKVNHLKEQIFRTKYRLATLAETVIGGDINSGAKLALWHRNELGSSYVLVSAAYTLDGAPLYTKVDESGDLNDREEFVVFDQRIVPGQHQIAVQYKLRGHGYGIFSYLEGMTLTMKGSYSFNVEPGKITKVTSIVYEKEGLTLEFKDKPDVKFELNVAKDIVKPSEDQASAPAVPQANAEGARP